MGLPGLHKNNSFTLGVIASIIYEYTSMSETRGQGSISDTFINLDLSCTNPTRESYRTLSISTSNLGVNGTVTMDTSLTLAQTLYIP